MPAVTPTIWLNGIVPEGVANEVCCEPSNVADGVVSASEPLTVFIASPTSPAMPPKPTRMPTTWRSPAAALPE